LKKGQKLQIWPQKIRTGNPAEFSTYSKTMAIEWLSGGVFGLCAQNCLDWKLEMLNAKEEKLNVSLILRGRSRIKLIIINTLRSTRRWKARVT